MRGRHEPARAQSPRTLLARVAQVVLLASAYVVAVALRRPDQFARPSIWAESGVAVLAQFLKDGIVSLFEPVNGYQIPGPTVIAGVHIKL